MKTIARYLAVVLSLTLLLSASDLSGRDAATLAQNTATYYQITNNTGEFAYLGNTTPGSLRIAGNGQRVAWVATLQDSYRQHLYLANSDGSSTPELIHEDVSDYVGLSYTGDTLLYTSQGRLFANQRDITPCVTDPRISEPACLEPWDFALSGNGDYAFFLSPSQWDCTPVADQYGTWRWQCAFDPGTNNEVIWRIATNGGSPPEQWTGRLGSASGHPSGCAHLQTDFSGSLLVFGCRSDGVELYTSRGGRTQQHRPVYEAGTEYSFNYFALSADGHWVAYGTQISGSAPDLHVLRSDGSQHTIIRPQPPAMQTYTVHGISEDGARILFNKAFDSMQNRWYGGEWLVNADGSDLVPVVSNTEWSDRYGSLSYDGQSVAFVSEEDILGNGNSEAQLFVLLGPALPDLRVDAFDLDPAAVLYQQGRYIHPVAVTLRNTGRAAAVDFQVRFSDNGGWSETRAIASLAAGESTVLEVEWEITHLLEAGQGQARVELTVAADPDDIIAESSKLNNTARAAAEVDARPRLSQVQAGYRPGAFLAGVSLANNFDVWVDWNGDLSGGGAAGESQAVVYALNGAEHSVAVNNPTAAPAASHTYDMGSELQAGANVLHIQAENAAGFFSDRHTLTLHRADNAAWLGAVAFEVSAEPPDALYDKVAVYIASFAWPVEAVEGYFDVPEGEVNLLKKEYGPKIDAWTLEVEFRSDGVGTLTGGGTFEGELKGVVAVETTVTASGSVRATDQLRLTHLEGQLRGEGQFDTPRVPLTPWLPFLYAQARLGAGADATLGVYEQDNGELEWSPLVLGLDATVEGLLSSGVEGVAYVEGGVGGQPRAEFNLPPDPDLLRALNIRLYAWGKAQFLIWEKGYEAEYLYVVAGDGAQLYTVAPQPQASGWQLRAVRAAPGGLSGTGPEAMGYAYADPALAVAADDTMMLVWVDDVGSHLQLRASRWDGAAWSATADVTANAFLDASPALAYDSVGKAVALWVQLPDAAPPADPHAALPAMEIVSSVWDGSAWSAPVTLTQDAQLDLRPHVAADRAGHVMAVWVKDADGAYPLFPDEEDKTLGGDLHYALWDGAAWSSPALAVSGIASSEAPQLARAGDTALAVWSHDADGSVGTITDTAIYYAAWISPTWSAAQPLAGLADGVADFAPRVAFDGAGRANLVWVRGRVAQSADPDDAVDQLYFATYSAGTWSTPEIAVEAPAISAPQLLVDAQDNLIVLWLARSDTGENLWYAVYDRDAALWSAPLLLTDDADAPTDYAAVLDSHDTLHVVLSGRQVITASHPVTAGLLHAAPAITYPVFGAVRSATLTHTLGHDLTLTDLSLSPANPAPGATAILTATARNSGDLAVTGALVAFYDGDPDAGGSQIGSAQAIPAPFRAGDTAQVSVIWQAPAEVVSHTLYAVIDPANAIPESDETNNRVARQTVLPDLHVAWAHATWNSAAITVTAHVHNQGVSAAAAPFTVTLRLADPYTGTLLAQTPVSAPLLPDAGVTAVFTLDPAAIPPGAHTAWVVVDAENIMLEADETNNTAFTALAVAPDLTLSAADIARDDPVRITLHNTGIVTATEVLITVRAGGIAGPLLDSHRLPNLAGGSATTFTPTLAPGTHTLYVQLDPEDTIAELDESNNLAVREVTVRWRSYLPLVLRQ